MIKTIMSLSLAMVATSSMAYYEVNLKFSDTYSAKLITALIKSNAFTSNELKRGEFSDEAIHRSTCYLTVNRPSSGEAGARNKSNRLECTFFQKTTPSVLHIGLPNEMVSSHGEYPDTMSVTISGPITQKISTLISSDYILAEDAGKFGRFECEKTKCNVIYAPINNYRRDLLQLGEYSYYFLDMVLNSKILSKYIAESKNVSGKRSSVQCEIIADIPYDVEISPSNMVSNDNVIRCTFENKEKPGHVLIRLKDEQITFWGTRFDQRPNIQAYGNFSAALYDELRRKKQLDNPKFIDVLDGDFSDPTSSLSIRMITLDRYINNPTPDEAAPSAIMCNKNFAPDSFRVFEGYYDKSIYVGLTDQASCIFTSRGMFD